MKRKYLFDEGNRTNRNPQFTPKLRFRIWWTLRHFAFDLGFRTSYEHHLEYDLGVTNMDGPCIDGYTLGDWWGPQGVDLTEENPLAITSRRLYNMAQRLRDRHNDLQAAIYEKYAQQAATAADRYTV